MPPIWQVLRSGLSRGGSKPPRYAPSAENLWTRALFRSVTKTSSFLLMAMPIGEKNSPGLSPFLPQVRTNLGPSGESARRLPGAKRSSIATSRANISWTMPTGLEAMPVGGVASSRNLQAHRDLSAPSVRGHAPRKDESLGLGT